MPSARSCSTFRCVAAFDHIVGFIAGATRTGLSVAKRIGGSQVVGDPVRHLGKKVGGRRRDDDEIGLAREPDMADLVLVLDVEEIPMDTLAADRGNGERRHELMRRAAHRRADARAVILQAANELEHLIGGDAAADDDQDFPAGKGHALS